MHYYLNDGILYLKYAESGCNIKNVDSKYKHLKIEVPKNIDYNFSLVSTNLTANSLTGNEIEIDTVSSSITINKIECADFDLDTVSGSYLINELNAENINVDTVSGEINLSQINTDKLDISGISALVYLDILKANTIKYDTVSGDIDVKLNGLGFKLDFSTTSGKVISSFGLKINGNIYSYLDEAL